MTNTKQLMIAATLAILRAEPDAVQRTVKLTDGAGPTARRSGVAGAAAEFGNRLCATGLRCSSP